MLGYQARAMKSALAKTGQGALLRGVNAGFVTIERDVHIDPLLMNYADDNAPVRFTVASISNDYAPKVGDILDHPEGRFMLDRLLQDNGAISRFIVAVAVI